MLNCVFFQNINNENIHIIVDTSRQTSVNLLWPGQSNNNYECIRTIVRHYRLFPCLFVCHVILNIYKVKINKMERGRPKLSDSERKRRKTHRYSDLSKTRIYLGSEAERWDRIKKENNLKSDREIMQMSSLRIRPTMAVNLKVD